MTTKTKAFQAAKKDTGQSRQISKNAAWGPVLLLFTRTVAWAFYT